jgi:hypothetical protein
MMTKVDPRKRRAPWKDYNRIQYSLKKFREDQRGLHAALRSKVIQFPPHTTLTDETSGEKLRLNTTDPTYKASMYFVRKYGETSAAYHLRHLAVTRFVRVHGDILVRKGLVRKPKTEGDRIWVEERSFRYLLKCRMRGRFGNFPKTVISRYFEKY